MASLPPAPSLLAPCPLRLTVQGPADLPGLASWFASRAVPGVESVVGTAWSRALRLPNGPAILSADLATVGTDTDTIVVTAELSDAADEPAAAHMARRLLDLDADPARDAELAAAMPELSSLIAARPGMRIPGTPSLAEALLWAITGQQISASQARDQIERATDLLAQPLPRPAETPTPSTTAHRLWRLPVDPCLAAERADDWFRGPGARRRCLQQAVPAAAALEPAPIPELRRTLLALPGIGPWTADYALLRGAGAVDVAPARDAALLQAARGLGIAEDHPTLSAWLDCAAPWRSLAVMHLWHHAAALRPPQPSARR